MASPVSNSTVSISSAALSAEISASGAELVRLHDHAGADLLWDGDPAVWNGRSPLLFPIVGEVKVEMNAEKRLALIRRALELNKDEINVLPLHRQVIPWAVRANVTVPHRADNFVTPYWTTIE